MSYSLNKFFKAIGSTRQVFHVKLNRYMQREEEMGQLSLIVTQVRKDHPGMALRDLYQVIQPATKEETGLNNISSKWGMV